MKYGLMYYKATDNIGDDIQTYVAMKYLPHIDYYIDREALSCFVPKEKEYVSMIMNGWYIHNKIAWPPSPYINPLLISMHFKSLEDTDVGDSYLSGFGGEFLKKYGPVGARDLETGKRLEENGISAYFSGCMTLTLDKFKNVEKENKIILVDVENEIIEKVKDSVRDINNVSNSDSKNNDKVDNSSNSDSQNNNKVNNRESSNNSDSIDKNRYDVEILSHLLDPKETEKKSIEERMNNVENLLKKYQGAHLVITSRLHVALPCIALETPVIILHKELFDRDRLGTFFYLVDNYTNTDFLKIDIKEILKKPRTTSKKYLDIKYKIDKKCKDFIKQCEAVHLNNQKLDNDNLPEIENYKNYVSNINWYKNIYEKERQALENTEKKRVEEFYKYKNEVNILNSQKDDLNQNMCLLKIEKENYENQNEVLRSQNEVLKRELSDIYNSKGWKYLEKIRKFI